jgi:hypothetical protein
MCNPCTEDQLFSFLNKARSAFIHSFIEPGM